MNDQSSDKTNTEQKRRGFRPGQSGNPKGRALASKNNQDIKQIVEKTVKLAKAGEEWAVMAILARLWPAPKGQFVRFDIPNIRSMADVAAALDSLLQAVATGRITIPESNELSAMVERQANILKMSDVEKRLLAIEAKQ